MRFLCFEVEEMRVGEHVNLTMTSTDTRQWLVWSRSGSCHLLYWYCADPCNWDLWWWTLTGAQEGRPCQRLQYHCHWQELLGLRNNFKQFLMNKQSNLFAWLIPILSNIWKFSIFVLVWFWTSLWHTKRWSQELPVINVLCANMKDKNQHNIKPPPPQ